MRLKFLSIIVSFLIVSVAVSSCLGSDNNYEFSTDATIHAFQLDTIYGKTYKFEIDQIQRIIYNRDSLPMSADTIIDRIGVNGMSGSIRGLARAILGNDVPMMESRLKELLENAISCRVLDNEHSYQAFIAGLLMNLFGNYELTADFESGQGYHDIRLKRRYGNGPNIVMEIKRSGRDATSPERLLDLANDALDQVRNNDYAHGMTGRTVLYGIAFSGKTPTIVSEVIKMP